MRKEIFCGLVRQARRVFTGLERSHRFEQKLPHLNDIGVAYAKMLFAPVHNRTHTLSDAGVLSIESLDTDVA